MSGFTVLAEWLRLLGAAVLAIELALTALAATSELVTASMPTAIPGRRKPRKTDRPRNGARTVLVFDIEFFPPQLNIQMVGES